MSLQQLHNVIRQVILSRDAAETRYIYVTFPALSQSGPCEKCLENETQEAYTEEEILLEFEYAEKESEDVWLPKVHPNCVCRMFPYDVVDVPEKLTDKEFDDWLTGLLALGYISAAIYDQIVARRKKKKEAN